MGLVSADSCVRPEGDPARSASGEASLRPFQRETHDGNLV